MAQVVSISITAHLAVALQPTGGRLVAAWSHLWQVSMAAIVLVSTVVLRWGTLSWLLWGLAIDACTLVITGCTMAGTVGCSGACYVNAGYMVVALAVAGHDCMESLKW